MPLAGAPQPMPTSSHKDAVPICTISPEERLAVSSSLAHGIKHAISKVCERSRCAIAISGPGEATSSSMGALEASSVILCFPQIDAIKGAAPQSMVSQIFGAFVTVMAVGGGISPGSGGMPGG